MTKQVILIGELKIGDGVVHQRDFAEALGAERLTAWPKDMTDVEVIVGRLLANRKPAMLVRADKNEVPTATVDSKLTPEVTSKLIEMLEGKSKLETYEERALVVLKATIQPEPSSQEVQAMAQQAEAPKRGKKSKKGAANG